MNTYSIIEPLLCTIVSQQEAREQALALLHGDYQKLHPHIKTLEFPVLFWNLCRPDYQASQSLFDILHAYKTENNFPRFSEHLSRFTSEELYQEWHTRPARSFVRFRLSQELLQRGDFTTDSILSLEHEHFTYLYHYNRRYAPDILPRLIPFIQSMLNKTASYVHIDAVYIRHNPDFIDNPECYLPFITRIVKGKTHHQKTLILDSLKKTLINKPDLYELFAFYVLTPSSKWQAFLAPSDYVIYYLHAHEKNPSFWNHLSDQQQEKVRSIQAQMTLTHQSLEQVLHARMRDAHTTEMETPLLI